MTAYYNEIDDYAARWLENLIEAGHIAPGVVDRRSIVDVRPSDLDGFAQCHFFAGIGVWSLALRRAGWGDTRPVWTGSCPCQPFSSAGKGGGFDDERHLWPYFHHLIRVCRPEFVIGEQVASKDGLAWIDLVQDDMEGEGYTFGAADTCAAGFGAPHIRQRLYWVAHAPRRRKPGWIREFGQTGRDAVEIGGYGSVGGMADPEHPERRAICPNREDGCDGEDGRRQKTYGEFGSCREIRGVADAECDRVWSCRPNCPNVPPRESQGIDGEREWVRAYVGPGNYGMGACPGPANGLWGNVDWLFCRDGKWRATEPSIFPLVDGASFRMGHGGALEGKSRQGMLKGAGNAITLGQAQGFIEAVMDCIPEMDHES